MGSHTEHLVTDGEKLAGQSVRSGRSRFRPGMKVRLGMQEK
ncbi:MAG: hypothetical protein ACLUD2_13665 [Clostridium sp.]